MRARNPLYVMAKPPPEAQALIAALPRNDPGRGPELLHVTLLTLFDLHHAPPEWLGQVIAALNSFEGSAFPLAFDRIENRKAVTLRTRAPLAEARAFQQALVRHLLACKAPMMLGTTPEPHVTINYRGDRHGSQKMAPIGWTVGEIILMESVVGKTTHVEHGRWPLTNPETPMTAPALLLAALLAPAMAQDPPVSEIECSYVTAPDGQPGDVVKDANLKVLVQTAAPGQYRSGLPAGVEIACVRSSIVPAPNDWKVIADGHPFYIVEQLPGGGYDRIGVIEFADGRFRYRLVRGQLNAEEAKRVDRRMQEFQAALP